MNDKKRELAQELVKRLNEAGHEAFFAGGCVRDMLMNKCPIDYDIATSAKPNEVMSLFKKTVPVGIQFGVVLVLLPEGEKDREPFEVATFRSEGEYLDGRHPKSVEFTNAKQDVLRRDFTVNGLLYDPLKKQVMDYVEGQIDIKERRIRAIGNPEERFEEDKLRILRAIRFAVNLEFEIEKKTYQALATISPKILEVSHERIRDELIKMFTGPHPGRALELLNQTGLLKIVLPEVESMKGVEQPPQFHPEGDVYIHTKMMLDMLKNSSLTLSFGALMHDVGKPPTKTISDRIRFNNHDKVGANMTEKIFKRLRFSNRETDDVVACVDNHMRFKDVKKMREAKLKRFMARSTFETELELHRIDCLCSHKILDNWEFLKVKYEAYKNQPPPQVPLIRGTHLIELGYQPGPLFKEILRAVEDQVLENTLSTPEEALDWVKKNFTKPTSES